MPAAPGAGERGTKGQGRRGRLLSLRLLRSSRRCLPMNAWVKCGGYAALSTVAAVITGHAAAAARSPPTAALLLLPPPPNCAQAASGW